MIVLAPSARPTRLAAVLCFVLFRCAAAPDAVAPEVSALPGTDQGPVTSTELIWFERDVSRHPALPDAVHGVAVADYDADGDQDIVFAIDRPRGLLLQNQGDGTFVDATASSGLAAAMMRASVGVVWVDVDGDGRLDLFVTRAYDTNYLFLGQEGGKFLDVSLAWGLDDSRPHQGASFADLDRDGDLDAFIAVDRDPAMEKIREIGERGAPDVALRNDGDHFTDVTEEWNLGTNPTGETYGSVLFDMDGDFAPDVFVVHDYRTNEFWRNDGNGHFTRARSWGTDEAAGLMGNDVADFDGDGLLDIFSTDYGPDDLRFGHPASSPMRFVDQFEATLGGGNDPTASTTGWGCALIDVDNDMDLDVFTVAAFSNERDQIRDGGLRFLENLGRGREAGTLIDRSDGVGPDFFLRLHGYGLSMGDLDLDGDVDVVIGIGTLDEGIRKGADLETKSLILWNRSAAAKGTYLLTVELDQAGTKNRFAVGARVDVEVGAKHQARVVLAGSSYLSSIGPQLYFGLGAASRADRVRVVWPDGAESVATDVPAGVFRITRPP